MTSVMRSAVLCLTALALVATGCGSDTKKNNDYVDAVNKAQTAFADNVKKVGSSAPLGGDAAAAAKQTFSDLSAAIDKVIADLKAVEPPDEVKDLHNQLISELREFGTQVADAGRSLTSSDPQAIATAQSKFATSASSLGTRISKTISDINAKLQA
jgi:membrane-bound lytic murein transglycosylase B